MEVNRGIRRRPQRCVGPPDRSPRAVHRRAARDRSGRPTPVVHDRRGACGGWRRRVRHRLGRRGSGRRPDCAGCRDARMADGGQVQGLDTGSIVVSFVFGPVFFPYFALTITVAWGLVARHLWRPILLAVGTGVAVAGVRLTAIAVGRNRPPAADMLTEVDTSESFPSGHVVGASTFILLIAYLVFSRRQAKRIAAISFVVAGLAIVVTSLSRMYLGYHWATDFSARCSWRWSCSARSSPSIRGARRCHAAARDHRAITTSRTPTPPP